MSFGSNLCENSPSVKSMYSSTANILNVVTNLPCILSEKRFNESDENKENIQFPPDENKLQVSIPTPSATSSDAIAEGRTGDESPSPTSPNSPVAPRLSCTLPLVSQSGDNSKAALLSPEEKTKAKATKKNRVSKAGDAKSRRRRLAPGMDPNFKMREEVEIKYDKTRKNVCSLIVNRFKFTRSRDGANGRIFWRCSRRDCRATAITIQDVIYKVKLIHIHDPPPPSEFFGEGRLTGCGKLQWAIIDDEQLMNVEHTDEPLSKRLRLCGEKGEPLKAEIYYAAPRSPTTTPVSFFAPSEELACRRRLRPRRRLLDRLHSRPMHSSTPNPSFMPPPPTSQQPQEQTFMFSDSNKANPSSPTFTSKVARLPKSTIPKASAQQSIKPIPSSPPLPNLNSIPIVSTPSNLNSFPNVTPLPNLKPDPNVNLQNLSSFPNVTPLPNLKPDPNVNLENLSSIPNVTPFPNLTSIPNLNLQSLSTIPNVTFQNLNPIPSVSTQPNLNSAPNVNPLQNLTSAPNVTAVPNFNSIQSILSNLSNAASASNLSLFSVLPNIPLLSSTIPHRLKTEMETITGQNQSTANSDHFQSFYQLYSILLGLESQFMSQVWAVQQQDNPSASLTQETESLIRQEMQKMATVHQCMLGLISANTTPANTAVAALHFRAMEIIRFCELILSRLTFNNPLTMASPGQLEAQWGRQQQQQQQ